MPCQLCCDDLISIVACTCSFSSQENLHCNCEISRFIPGTIHITLAKRWLGGGMLMFADMVGGGVGNLFGNFCLLIKQKLKDRNSIDTSADIHIVIHRYIN